MAGEITGDYSGNKFVSDTLAGVDRVSYAGKTEQVSYEELCTDENLPDDYRKFTLKFVSDGKTMKEQAFSYGRFLRCGDVSGNSGKRRLLY